MKKNYKVNLEIAIAVLTHISRERWDRPGRMAKLFKCDRRTVGRVCEYLEDRGRVVKDGYGYRVAGSGAAQIGTLSVESAKSANIGTLSAQIGTSQPHSVYTKKECPGIVIDPRHSDGSFAGMEDEHVPEESLPDGGHLEEESDAAHCVGAAPSEGGKWDPDEIGLCDKEYDEEFEGFNGWSDTWRPPTEIRIINEGGAAERINCDVPICIDRDLVAYHKELTKLIAVVSMERDARKNSNRRLGKMRKDGTISKAACHKGQQDHSQLLDIGVDLADDLESGELRYANLWAAG